MALPTPARTSYDADKAVTQARTAALVGRDLKHVDIPFYLEFAETNNPTASWVEAFPDPAVVTPDISNLIVPAYADGLYLHGIVECKVDSGTGEVRIGTDVLGGTIGYGTAATFTSATYVNVEVVVQVAAVDTWLVVEVRHQTTTTNTYCRATLGLTWWFSETA